MSTRYVRTAAGQAEIQGRTRQLSRPVRNLLLVINDSRGIEEWVIDLFPVLKDFLDRYGGNLSGGQQQQLAIARALLAQPKILLLDEPTEGIQPNIVEEIEEVITRLNREHGITVVLVEQNVAVSLGLASRAYVIENGRIALSGTGKELLADDRVKQAYLGL